MLLNIKRKTAAASNGNALVVFHTNSDGTDVASIRAHRESANDDAYLGFATKETGESISEKLRITSDGYARLATANARLEWVASSGSNPFIRSIGSGQQELEFNTGGDERFRITSTGALNIGKGDEASNAANLVEMYVGATDETYATIRGKYNRTNEFNRSEIRFGVQDNANGRGFLAFATGNNSATEKLRITHDGNVGIGSDDPQNKLDVAGDVKILDNSPRLFFNDAILVVLQMLLANLKCLIKMEIKMYSLVPFLMQIILFLELLDEKEITSDGNVGINSNSPRSYGN